MHEKIKETLLEQQYDRIQELETKLRHLEIFSNELQLELNITKKALYFASHNIMLSRYHDHAEARKETLSCMKIYMQKGRQCSDPEDVAL